MTFPWSLHLYFCTTGSRKRKQKVYKSIVTKFKHIDLYSVYFSFFCVGWGGGESGVGGQAYKAALPSQKRSRLL